MSEAKFTEGPWTAVDNGAYWDVLEKAPGYRGQVCSVHDAENINGITRDEQIANAHLIAAAPELYEALDNALDILKNDKRSYVQDAATECRMALAKARGEA